MASAATQVTVINPQEGKRYKMTLRGDISRLSIRKFKQYLANSCGIPEQVQVLKFNGVVLGDAVMAGEVGIAEGCTLTVDRAGPQSESFVASPARQNLELETLDQQRSVLLSDRLRRDEEFRRHHEVLTRSLTDAESRRRNLEREQQERQQEMDHLRDLEERAEAERRRVAALRAAEAERENLRSKDLEARRAQLHAERTSQRQLEMQTLENERKKMLLAQQRAEYEAERARLDREREDYFERRRQQELEIKEREFTLERQQIEAERARRELELEKLILHEKRGAEMSRVGLAPAQPHTLNGTGLVPLGMQQQQQNQSYQNQSQPASAPMTPRGPPHPTAAAAPHHHAPSHSRDASVVIQQESIHPPPHPQAHVVSPPPAPQRLGVRANMEANLASLAAAVGLDRLLLDDNNTCVVTYQERYTLLLTFDAATERLYLYSTLTTAIPKDADRKLRLYEFLLEGALLGRDMCGGGVGASLKNDFILMSTSLYLPECGPTALAVVAPIFVESLAKWRGRIKERGLVDPDDDASRSMLREASGASTMTRHTAHSHHGNQHQHTVGGGAPSQSQASAAGYDGGYRSLSMQRGAPSASPQQPQQMHPDGPYIGLEVSDGEVINGYKHQYTTGVLVMAAKGPAQRAGLIAQDFIKSVGGRPITSLEAFRAAVRALRPNESVTFVADRAGSEIALTVLVGSASLAREY